MSHKEDTHLATTSVSDISDIHCLFRSLQKRRKCDHDGTDDYS